MVTAVANVTMRESKARSTMQKRAGHSLPRFIVSRSISNSDTVSYTHLDVYKRQHAQSEHSANASRTIRATVRFLS